MDERKWFGTDGVRGVANRPPMTPEFALELGRAVGHYLRAALGRAPKVLIGKDTRRSGYMVETALTSGLCSVGADVHLLGPLPTPGIAFLTGGLRADAGLVISASHNPYEDNGIKIFGRDGYKLPDALELALEGLVGSRLLAEDRPTGTAIGRAWRIEDAVGRYAVFAKMAFPQKLTLEGMRIVVDCAHGAAYRVAPEVLRELGADVISLGVEPDGTNINGDCGALHPENMIRKVHERRADLGIALDGDADRCILCDERGQIVDGDVVLAILGRALEQKGRLAQRTVVATVMSNIGLERSLREVGVRVVRVGVGDRYVVERMRAEGLTLGGEQSGHVILLDHSTTGDGLVTALSVLGIMVETGRSLYDLAGCMVRYPQVLLNIDVARREDLDSLPEVVAAIRGVERELGEEGRVLVRYSGTQKKVRVMVEGPEEPMIRGGAERIVAVIEKSLR